MADLFVPHVHVAMTLAHRPAGYADMLARAEVRRDGRGVWYDRRLLAWPPAPVIPPHPLLSPPPAVVPDRAWPATVAARLVACRACPHLRPGDRCGVLVGRGYEALVMHRLGVPRAAAKCPDGRWGPET